MTMASLRDLVLDAHGAAQWKRFCGIQGDMSIVGLLWARKGWPDVLRKVRVTANIAEQQISYLPFTANDLQSFYRPDLVAIDTLDGKRLKQRANPRDSFDGHTPATRWDDLHLAYFSGYAMWNYLNTPFMFALPDFETEEIEPWNENGERWRRLKVTFPDSVATHSSAGIQHQRQRPDHQTRLSGERDRRCSDRTLHLRISRLRRNQDHDQTARLSPKHRRRSHAKRDRRRHRYRRHKVLMKARVNGPAREDVWVRRKDIIP
jgi:hypothetical protein